MTIILNHMVVPAHDRDEAAGFFANVFGLKYDGPGPRFAPVHVNDTLTLDFATVASFEKHHYAFHVSDTEFDAILGRIRRAGIAYGSSYRFPQDGQLNSLNGGRGFYFSDSNGHSYELLTRT
ncbi:MAG: VOC family protein [Beijerinckiaceae bacterium]